MKTSESGRFEKSPHAMTRTAARRKSRLFFGVAVPLALVLLADGLEAKWRDFSSGRMWQSVRSAGVIAGVVLDRQSNVPIRDSTVLLVGLGRRQSLTDEHGRFRFDELAPARYTLLASGVGYLNGVYGRSVPDTGGVAARVIVLGQNEVFADARVYLTRPGAISGTVSNERGEPIPGAYVAALPRVMLSGVYRLAMGPMATTDSSGVFRIGSLPGGDYVVGVSSAAAEPGSFGPRRVLADTSNSRASHVLYYPSARSTTDAARLRVAVGEELSTINIRLPASSGRRIAGRVVGPPDALRWAIVRLFPAGDESLCTRMEGTTAIPKADGTFEFLNVPVGQYVIRAMHDECVLFVPGGGQSVPLPARFGFAATRSVLNADLSLGLGTQALDQRNPDGTYVRLQPQAPYWGEVHVALDPSAPRDVTDVAVTMRRAARITGTIVLPAGVRPQGLLYADPLDGDPSMGRPAAVVTGSEFVIDGLRPAVYVLNASLSSDLVVKSIAWSGTEAPSRSFDATEGHDVNGVTVTLARGGSIVGVVRDAQGRSSATGNVIFFPTDQLHWTSFGFTSRRIGQVPTDSTGSYRSPPVPAGDYYVVAATLDESVTGGWQDPVFLRSMIGRSTKVHVDWSATANADLPLVTVAR